MRPLLRNVFRRRQEQESQAAQEEPEEDLNTILAEDPPEDRAS
jgi:hypothetical protein